MRIKSSILGKDNIMKVAITNQKGGVGKTTIAFNLAKGLAKQGYKVLAIDNDPQGNLTEALIPDINKLQANIFNIYKGEGGVIPDKIGDNLDLIGATIHLAKISEEMFDLVFRLQEGIQHIENNYDFIFIDCLPSFGYLHTAALKAADKVLIPIKPAPFALSGLEDLFDVILKMKSRINENLDILGILITFFEKTSIAKWADQSLREYQGDLVFNSVISKSVKLEESPMVYQSIMEYATNSKQANQFQIFISEFLEKVNNGNE